MSSIPAGATVPWPALGVERELFRTPPREYGILPFWFLNGELDPDEMRWQLRELREKKLPGIILHGRYGLETPYIGETYLDRIRLAVDEAEKLDLKTWVYDEMNWPSGTADRRVLQARPDLAQRYIQCVAINVRGPWFAYLTGEDSRYLDFQRSTPVAAFAIGSDGEVRDLTPNLSFEKVIPWQVPPGDWRLLYIVEKTADYYIDALDPESTEEFLRLGYEPYVAGANGRLGGQIPGFYTDEPAMHYFLSAQDIPIVPWTKDMFRRFRDRNGYELRRNLPHLFFDLGLESARIRFDFYETLTAFYSDAYYRQISEWCASRGVLFTGHLLYEEWLRSMIRVEGNPFRHYEHLHVVGVDHLYPIIGERDNPAEHVAMKLASSAAHQVGSERLLCESFGGMFMDATMQRMKWIADWEYVLGVNLLNPHGFHYTLEGPRKRDWPPSMFYQYPWWRYYGEFSDYIARLSYLLTGGRHVAKLAVLWPMTSMFANYTPQARGRFDGRTESDFNVLTDLLLRTHHDFDYVDDDALARAEIGDGVLRLGDEEHELVVLPPITHLKLEALEALERFVESGGAVLGMVFLPDRAFGPDGLVDVADRVQALFGIDPRATQREFADAEGLEVTTNGRVCFVRTSMLDPAHDPARPMHPVEEGAATVVERGGYFESSRHYLVQDGERVEITDAVAAARAGVARAFAEAIEALVEPDVTLDNDELFCLHRVKDERDVYFVVNPTGEELRATMTVGGEVAPLLWDPSTGGERPLAPVAHEGGRTAFPLVLPPVGSAFVVAGSAWRVVDTGGLAVDAVDERRVRAHGSGGAASLVVERDGVRETLSASAPTPPEPLVLDGEWEFAAGDGNALVLRDLEAVAEGEDEWLPVVPGAWQYQQPAEPDSPYPFAVRYRARFEVVDVPSRLELILDGFAGSEWGVLLNGERAGAEPQRSRLDSQMRSLPLDGLVRAGTNELEVRLVLTRATDGLLDLVKLVGDFALDARHALVAAPQRLAPDDWTTQGFPFYSGSGVYRRTVEVPEVGAARAVLVADAGDDAVEVLVNGESAGVRLWAPYDVDVTGLLRPGENTVELRVANTPVNLLEATPRRSGLAGAPRLVFHAAYELELPS